MDELQKLTRHVYRSIEALTRRRLIPGVGIHVATGAQVHDINWGIGDVGTQSRMRTELRYHAASLARVVANRLILDMINPATPLNALPPFRQACNDTGYAVPADVLLRHLLMDSSGLPDVNLLEPDYQEPFDLADHLRVAGKPLHAANTYHSKNYLAGLCITAMLRHVAGADFDIDAYWAKLLPTHECAAAPLVQGWSLDFCFRKNLVQPSQVDCSRAEPLNLDKGFWETTLSTRAFSLPRLATIFRGLALDSAVDPVEPLHHVIPVYGRRNYFARTETGLLADDDGLRWLIDDFSAETVEMKYFPGEDLLIAVGTNSDCRNIGAAVIDLVRDMLLGPSAHLPRRSPEGFTLRGGIYRNRLGYMIELTREGALTVVKRRSTPYFHHDDALPIAAFSTETGAIELRQHDPRASLSLLVPPDGTDVALVVDGDVYVHSEAHDAVRASRNSSVTTYIATS